MHRRRFASLRNVVLRNLVWLAKPKSSANHTQPVLSPLGIRWSIKARRSSIFVVLFLLAVLLDWPLTVGNKPLVAQGTATTVRVSLATDGTQGNSSADRPWISADGRYVVFLSNASNLVGGDTNIITDVFVRDRQTGQTTRVSVATDGTQANNASDKPAISSDGRYVAFVSSANNLVNNDTNNTDDIFVRDRQTSQTSRVSIATNGVQADNYSDDLAISGDGRYVVFESAASNLVSGDTNGYLDIFVHDRQIGQTSRISVASDGAQANSPSSRPAISADGHYVVFESGASNLVSGDTNGATDVFIHDRQANQTSRISIATDGSQGNNSSWSYSSAISGDGRYVVFSSAASNLVGNDTNGGWDVFVRDRQTSQTSRVSVASGGVQGNAAFQSSRSAISNDGRYVTFSSSVNNLVSGDTNNTQDIFVHDRQTSQTSRASVASDGTQSNNTSEWSTISSDGRYVTFDSSASNLVSGDTNGVNDIFVRDQGGLCYTLTTAVNPNSGGAVTTTPAPNCQVKYAQGTVVSLSATANANYAFNQWSGSANSNANPLSITMDGDKNIVANFIPTNQPPSVNAGVDKTITLPTNAMLDGTVSDDGLPNPPRLVTTSWNKVSGQGTVTFGNAAVVDTTASFSAPGVYILRLTANDSALSAFDEVTITVNPPSTAFSCNNVTQIPKVECEALVALYNGTNGLSWKNKSGWSSTNTPCSWLGVKCNNNHVTDLYLQSNQLSGNIPPQLGNLTNLRYLDLYNNQLIGSIPPELGNLTNLIWFVLDANQLSGSIPPQLGSLTNLTVMDLISNQLTGRIPPELGNLTNLNGLWLNHNQLSGSIPTRLGNLANLEGLALSNNQLNGSLPPELGSLTKLTNLSLDNNQFNGALPASLVNLRLNVFYFYNTYLCEPSDAAFQNWLTNIANLKRTNILCGSSSNVQFSTAAYPVGENGGTATIQVTLSGASTQAITVDYATSVGTATPGSDYTAANGTLTFNPNETSKTFSVPILNDSLDEPDETVNLTLKNPTNAAPGTPASAMLTIIDDDTPQTGSSTCGQLLKTSGGLDQWFVPCSRNPPLIKLGYSQPPLGPPPSGLVDGAYYRVRDPHTLQVIEQCHPTLGCTNIALVIEVDSNPYDNWEQINSCDVSCSGNNNLIADFDATPLSGTAPLTVLLRKSAIGNVTRCLWDYGDGATGESCVDSHTHIYNAAGTYTVTLTVFDSVGASNKKIRSNYISVKAPVILLPGIMGSRLSNTPNPNGNSCLQRLSGEVWPNLSGLVLSLQYNTALNTLALEFNGDLIQSANPCDQITPSGIIDQVKLPGVDNDYYASFTDSLKSAGYSVYSYSYDWRLDIGTVAQEFEKYLNRDFPNTKVILIGHSQGGLVAREYLRRVGINRIEKVITVGTPYLGAPKAAYTVRAGALATEYKGLLEHIFSQDNRIRNDTLRLIVRNSPAANQLLPSRGYIDDQVGSYFEVNSGPLKTYADTRDFLAMNGQNGDLLNKAQGWHDQFDALLNLPDSYYYILVGNHQLLTPKTVHESYTYWPDGSINTRLNTVSYGMGDGTVPVESATLEGKAGKWSGNAVVCPFSKLQYDHAELLRNVAIQNMIKEIIKFSPSNCAGSEVLAAQAAPSSFEFRRITVWGPAQVTVADNAGRLTGPTSEGFVVTDIPDSSYEIIGDGTFVTVMPTDTYTIKLKMTGDMPLEVRLENFSMLAEEDSTISQKTVFIEVPSAEGGAAELTYNPAAPATSYQLKVDLDNNGTPDKSLPPDSVLTGEQVNDLTYPVTQIVLSGKQDSLGFYTGPVTVNLNAIDDLSGIQRIKYSLDGGNSSQMYTEPFTIVAEEVPVLYAQATDRAGNAEFPWATVQLRSHILYLPLIEKR